MPNDSPPKEHFEHDVCPKCGGPSVPFEGVADQAFRGCRSCDHEWFENLNEPPLVRPDGDTSRAARLEELRTERDGWTMDDNEAEDPANDIEGPDGKTPRERSWAEENPDEAEELAELEKGESPDRASGPPACVRVGGIVEHHAIRNSPMDPMISTIGSHYHRNGVLGEPFHVCTFVCDGRTMVGIVFESKGHVAVFDAERVGQGDVGFGTNSWHGDEFERPLRRAIAERRADQAATPNQKDE